MKNKTKTQKILVIVLVLCLVVGVIGFVVTMPTQREATVEEIVRYSGYTISEYNMPGEPDQNLRQLILAQCQADGTETVGANTYDRYISETLGQYLHKCASLEKIMGDGTNVYIQYTDPDGLNVFLTVDDIGVAEQSVYVPDQDIMFYANREVTLVYEQFSNYSVR